MSEMIDQLADILADGVRLDMPSADIVRALLVTLREPSSGMRWAVATLAAKAIPQTSWVPRNPEPATLLAPFGLDAWKAMIDAALA